MSSKTLNMSDALSAYLQDVSLRESDLMARLRHETSRLPMSGMQISPEQGQFMQLLVKALGIRRAIEHDQDSIPSPSRGTRPGFTLGSGIILRA